MKSVTTREARNRFSALLQEVSRGAEIEIRRGDRVIARLVPAVSNGNRRRPRVGTITSAPVRYDPDAFMPLDEAGMREFRLQ